VRVSETTRSKLLTCDRDKVDEVVDGLKKIGEGNYRVAYRIKTGIFGSEYKGKVMKFTHKHSFARGDNGVHPNEMEFKTWEEVSSHEELFQEFCPVRGKGERFRWILMDYACDIESWFKRIKAERLKRKIRNVMKNVEDLKADNIGVHSSKGLVFVDYPWGPKQVKDHETEYNAMYHLREELKRFLRH
jgi:hypothetical protein